MIELVHDLALATLMAWLLGVGAHLLRQPLLLAYLVAGFVLGPSGLQWVKSQEAIGAIAELGLIFMLFMVGLEIDLKKIIRTGKVIVVTATAQILGCCALGVLLFLVMGLPVWWRPLGRALPRCWHRAFEHRHHRQAVVRQARDRHIGRPHHPGRAGASRLVRHPIPRCATKPQ
jgi:Sodium/hydrogen exchanger family